MVKWLGRRTRDQQRLRVQLPAVHSLSLSLSLSLSGACHEEVAASTSRRHAGLSIARRLAVARPCTAGLVLGWASVCGREN